MQIDKNNWQIKIDKENRNEIHYYILNRNIKWALERYDIGSYISIKNGNLAYSGCMISGTPLITTAQFRKYILGKEDEYIITKEDNEKVTEYLFKKYCIKEERKIIGYKAPFDMWEGGKIKKGSLFVAITSDLYCCKDFELPKEIVEKYFDPVYEEEEKIIELHGYRISKDSIKVMDGEFELKDTFLKYAKIYNDVIKAYEELNK